MEGWVIGKRLCSARREGYGQGEEMAYGVTNDGPLMRVFMTNASDPAGLYQGNKRIPCLKQDVEINPFLPVRGETALLPSKGFCLYRLFYQPNLQECLTVHTMRLLTGLRWLQRYQHHQQDLPPAKWHL